MADIRAAGQGILLRNNANVGLLSVEPAGLRSAESQTFRLSVGLDISKGAEDNEGKQKRSRRNMENDGRRALSNRIISHLPRAVGRLYRVAHYSVATDRSLYKVFGVNRDATHQEIKEAFYRLSKLYHPDVTNEPHARAKFQELARAYEVLGNPSKRKEYDRGLIRPSSSSVSPDGTVAADIDTESIRSSTTDSFSAFYVKQYNRVLNEDWLRKSDPQLIKTAIEYKQDEPLDLTATVGGERPVKLGGSEV
ncbi:DnaJ domain protein [Opisthorchis viverrini]|uniref:DnaJ homolog subfamily B member 9 n=1 Tax=Opisthorchis viverrini TaxID=6198 RepID=A0A1S8WH85_OPIVI|nr:DnaJ domain protein [Opisthorchis viverrini]